MLTCISTVHTFNSKKAIIHASSDKFKVSLGKKGEGRVFEGKFSIFRAFSSVLNLSNIYILSQKHGLKKDIDELWDFLAEFCTCGSLSSANCI